MNFRDVGKQATGVISTGLNQCLPTRARGKFGILLYHRVVPRVVGNVQPWFNVTPRNFRRQLTGLLARGYQVKPLRDVLDAVSNQQTVDDRTTVITFDDGFESVYTHAWPVLRELNLPATVFISTAFLDSGVPFPFDDWAVGRVGHVSEETYLPMKSDQVREMLDSGLIEFGSHTHTHRDFRDRPNELRADIEKSLKVLESQFALTRPTFAFPFGKPSMGFADDELVEAAKQAGVCCSLTTEDALVSSHADPFHWGRFNVYDWDTPRTLDAKLNGWYGWAPQLQQSVAHWIGKRGRSTHARLHDATNARLPGTATLGESVER